METMENILKSSDFSPPDLTPEEWEIQNREAKEFEEEQLRLKISSRIADSSIPEAYRSSKVDHDDVSSWLENPSKGLLLQGEVGRGKTYQGIAALIRMAERGTVRFITFKQLFDDCKASFSGTETEREIVNRCKYCGCLMIDDFGAEDITKYTLPIVFDIIKSRDEGNKPTIITTNYTGQVLLEHLTLDGEKERAKAIISRLGGYKIVKVEGEDRRIHGV